MSLSCVYMPRDLQCTHDPSSRITSVLELMKMRVDMREKKIRGLPTIQLIYRVWGTAILRKKLSLGVKNIVQEHVMDV